MKIILALCLLLAPSAFAAPLETSSAIIFLPREGSGMTAAYLTFQNKGKEAIKVSAFKVPGFKVAELHETFETQGKTDMRRLNSLEVPAGGSAELKPGGNHLMLFDATKKFKAGEKVKAEFQANGKTERVTFVVKAR